MRSSPTGPRKDQLDCANVFGQIQAARAAWAGARGGETPNRCRVGLGTFHAILDHIDNVHPLHEGIVIPDVTVLYSTPVRLYGVDFVFDPGVPDDLIFWEA